MVIEGCYRSIIYLTGENIEAFLQPWLPNFIGMDRFEPYFPNAKTQKRSFYMKKLTEARADPHRYEQVGIKEKLEAYNYFMLQWGSLSFTRFQQYPVSTLVPTDALLNLDLVSSEHTLRNHKEKIKLLVPDLDVWEKKINRVLWRDGTLSYGAADDKVFYKSWLSLIQEFKSKNSESDLITDEQYSDLKNAQFSPGNSLDIGDLDIIERLSEVMIHIFGYTTYMMLTCGLVSFTESQLDQDDVSLNFITVNGDTLADIFNKLGVKSLSARMELGESYTSTAILNRENHIASLLLFGLRQDFEIDGIVRRLDTFPNCEGFIAKYFEVFNPDSYITYGKAINIIQNLEYAPFENYIKENINEMFTKGSYEMQKALMPIVNTIIKHLARPANFFWSMFPSDQHQYYDKWNERTIRQVFEFFNLYLLRGSDNPWGQIVRTMRDAFIAGTDCHLEIHARGATHVLRMRTITSNPLISYLSDKKLFTIPYEQLRILFSDMNVLLASRLIKEYRLDFDALWGEFGGKLRTIYTNLYDALSNIKTLKKSFRVKFFMETGAGFDRDSKLHAKSYTKTSLDFDNFEFPFDPHDSSEVHKAVQSIIFYTFFLPGTVACVYESSQKMIFGMDMTNIYTVEEMREVTMITNKFSSKPSNLFVYLADLEECLFEPGEIPWFLLFNPPNIDGSGELLPHQISDHSMRKQMLQYCASKYVKLLKEIEMNGQELTVFLEDLTENNYLFDSDENDYLLEWWQIFLRYV
ncbi:MAG: hypothetical protein EU548_07375 [Promethearchaeota archaeon]|nr:MAG: hypothetical protein EU548_07375 [Candidatus Lokiarchaeota archaeon]